jgi:hypothetical protein
MMSTPATSTNVHAGPVFLCKPGTRDPARFESNVGDRGIRINDLHATEYCAFSARDMPLGMSVTP